MTEMAVPINPFKVDFFIQMVNGFCLLLSQVNKVLVILLILLLLLLVVVVVVVVVVVLTTIISNINNKWVFKVPLSENIKGH